MATDERKQKLVPLYMGKQVDGENRKAALHNLCAALGYTRNWGNERRGAPGLLVRAMIDAWLAGDLPQWLREHADKLGQ
jgi:hypothetical protein